VPSLILAQATRPNATLRVNERPGQAPVIEIDGRSYVDLEAFAKLTNSSLTFQGNQITLTLPVSTPSVSERSDQADQAGIPAFSKEFIKAGIEEMSIIREWRSALVNAVQNGYPVTDALVAGYQGQAATNLRLASVAVSTVADRSAFQLLSNECNNMQKLNDKILGARKNMNFIATDALKDDPLDQKILNCARSLASMAANGQFADDGSCH
jgi:hypothetical protein